MWHESINLWHSFSWMQGQCPDLICKEEEWAKLPCVQGEATEAPLKRRRWLLRKAKQGFQQLQKLNLAFQDWTERFWKASYLFLSRSACCSAGSHCIISCSNSPIQSWILAT